MSLLQRHSVSFDEVVESAIYCHALASALFELTKDSILCDNSDDIIKKYNKLITKHLLLLAVTVRTVLYQGKDSEMTYSYASPSGFLFFGSDKDGDTQSFNIKDVCDKIIHANSTELFVEDATQPVMLKMTGEHQKKTWTVILSIQLFTQGVMNWACDTMKAV